MLNPKLPIVTAIIPCYNQGQWIRQSIQSIVDQTYKNIRIITVDDGSTDNSWEQIYNCFTKTPQPIKLNEQSDEPNQILGGQIGEIPLLAIKMNQNHGPSASRNYGIKVGWEGTALFAFLDGDDYYLQDKVALSVQEYMKYPNLVGIIYSDYTTLNTKTGAECRVYGHPYHREKLVQECIINMDSLYSRWIFEKVGLFDESLRTCEDYDMHLRATEHSIAVHLPQSLIKIRVGGHSSTSTVSKQNWEENHRKVFQKLEARLKDQ